MIVECTCATKIFANTQIFLWFQILVTLPVHSLVWSLHTSTWTTLEPFHILLKFVDMRAPFTWRYQTHSHHIHYSSPLFLNYVWLFKIETVFAAVVSNEGLSSTGTRGLSKYAWKRRRESAIYFWAYCRVYEKR